MIAMAVSFFIPMFVTMPIGAFCIFMSVMMFVVMWLMAIMFAMTVVANYNLEWIMPIANFAKNLSGKTVSRKRK